MLDHGDIHPIFAGAPDTTEFRKLRKRIVRLTREALDTYGMVRAGERWLVCLSGGKDSYTLLAALIELQWRGLLPVDLLACNLDQGQPGFPATVLPEFLAPDGRGAPDRVSRHLFGGDGEGAGGADLSARSARGCGAATSTGSRGRRGAGRWCSATIATTSSRPSCSTSSTAARSKAMPPKLLNDEGDLHVLRPLAHVAEEDCARFARAMGYPIIPCDLCGSQDGLQRAADQAHGRRVGGEEPRAAADPVPRARAGEAEPPARHRRSSTSRGL